MMPQLHRRRDGEQSAYLIPLRDQPVSNPIVCLFIVDMGLRLRADLRVPGLTDTDALRAELRRRELAEVAG